MDDSPATIEAISALSDEALLNEWTKSAWLPGDEVADALADEIERRKLDF